MNRRMRMLLTSTCLAALALTPHVSADTVVRVTLDRGRDLGQAFGSVFEATSDDGAVTVGAGFPNAYNTRYRNDRHAIQFFVRPNQGERRFDVQPLPRPNDLCGAYLYSQDDVVWSTYGQVKAWNPKTRQWEPRVDPDTPPNQPLGGTSETMRVGRHLVEFGASTVRCDGRVVLPPPDQGSYQLFFYANGKLCFYHVHRREQPYHRFKSDEDGFSRLYAVPWTPEQTKVDLNQAFTKTLPVVGETTFAWGQFGKQIVTGSNIGGFYVLEDNRWSMMLEPQLNVSYQLYSTLMLHDHMIMGQYPTGRLFRYDGTSIQDQPGWPPIAEGVSGSAREAQTTVLFGGELLVGVWPWGELWRYNPGAKQWSFVRRMFDHPQRSAEITHPYDIENKDNDIRNLWGQRVTSLVPADDGLYVSTSAKYPCQWEPEKFPFLKDKWQSYGSVYRLTTPGHLGASTKWTDGPTKFELVVTRDEMRITQDGHPLAAARLTADLARVVQDASFTNIQWGNGIYGKFSGPKLSGELSRE